MSKKQSKKNPAAVTLGKLGGRTPAPWPPHSLDIMPMPKPIPTSKHPAAVALGKLGKGRRKTMTPAAVEARRQTARTRRKAVKPLSDEEVQLPPGPMGAAAMEEDVD